MQYSYTAKYRKQLLLNVTLSFRRCPQKGLLFLGLNSGPHITRLRRHPQRGEVRRSHRHQGHGPQGLHHQVRRKVAQSKLAFFCKKRN